TLQIGTTEDGDRGIAAYGFEPTPGTLQEIVSLEFSKAICLSRQRSILEAVAFELEKEPLNGNFSLEDVYEFTPQGVDKAFGIQQVLREMGLTGLPVAVVGDGQNDVSMFAMADYSFAPLNGHK